MRTWNAILTVLVVAVLGVGVATYLNLPAETPESRAFQTGVYLTDGGDKMVVQLGGSVEVQSGASLQVTPGATVVLGSVTQDDGSFSDDVEIGGDLRVGNGTPTVAQNGEDTYLEGQVEIDGEAQFDGAIDANSTVQIDGATTIGVDGTSANFTLYSDTAGDYLLWDQANEKLVITGTNAANALEIPDGNLDVTDSINFGASNLYPLGYASDGSQLVAGTTTITGNGAVVDGLTTPVYGVCSISGQLTDNEEQTCSVVIAGGNVTLYVYKEDGSAGDSGAPVFWMVVGTP